MVEPPTSYFNRKELCLPSCCTYICQKLLVSGSFTCPLTFEVEIITTCQFYHVNHFQVVEVHYDIRSLWGVRDVLLKPFLLHHAQPSSPLVKSSAFSLQVLLRGLVTAIFGSDCLAVFLWTRGFGPQIFRIILQITQRTWSCLQLYQFPSKFQCYYATCKEMF